MRLILSAILDHLDAQTVEGIMDAIDLQREFTLGEWLVNPRGLRITGAAGTRVLTPPQMDLLLCLAEHNGEAVSRKALQERVWPGVAGSELMLQATIRSLREALGGTQRDQSCIVNVTGGGYSLVAHVTSSGPEVAHSTGARTRHRPAETDSRSAAPVSPPSSSWLYEFMVELRRRGVFKVAGAYLLGMWIVLQVAEVTFEPLRFPDWWMTALTILAVLGLPIVAVLAWSYEITAGGIVLDVGPESGIRMPKARRALAPALVAGVSLMALVTGYAWWRTIGELPPVEQVTSRFEPSPHSIAVLPLVDMSPTGEAAYLGDGLSEELSSDLAKLPGLRVAARSSAFAFRGKDIDVRTIGEHLGVRYVLEGSVRRDGERVRVTAQLVDASTGFQVWTESYDRPWQDLIGIQQDLSGAIARQLRTVMTPELAQQIRAASTDDPRAYDFYLAGVSQLRKGGGLSRIEDAESLFRRSLEADPGFARAQAGLCEVAITRYERTNDTEAVQAAEAACRAALEADATLKETEHALGRLYLASGRIEQAEAVYRSLLARAPADADVRIGLGRALARLNRPAEAEQSFREAIDVEPGYWQSYNSLGNFLFNVGRSDEAAKAYLRVTELAPGNPTGFNNLGAARMMAGDLGGSATAFEQSTLIEPSRSAYSNLGTLYYYLGNFEEAVEKYDMAITLASEDFQLWGSRGDAGWFLPRGRDRAREDFRRAAALAEKALAVNSTDGEIWALLGYYYSRLGEPDRSSRYVSRAMELAPDSPQATYFAAVAAEGRGDRQEASLLINRAIEQGYSKVLAVSDPALKGVPIR
jgi:TolB-like protein/Flp pilus assembly protein TadD/DNA-binding winged helix-turn-helix (wHTH) protein